MSPMRALGMIGAVAFASVAFADEVGVHAKVVKVFEKPGKAIVRIVWTDSAIHKGAAGPFHLAGWLRMCLTNALAGERTPLFEDTFAIEYNTETAAKYKNALDTFRTLVVKEGVSARAVLKSDQPIFGFGGVMGIVAWPPDGGSAALEITNFNGPGPGVSFHRLCTNLAGSASVVATEVAGGAGRKIIWREAPADAGCALFHDIEMTAGCSPSGAFVD